MQFPSDRLFRWILLLAILVTPSICLAQNDRLQNEVLAEREKFCEYALRAVDHNAGGSRESKAFASKEALIESDWYLKEIDAEQYVSHSLEDGKSILMPKSSTSKYWSYTEVDKLNWPRKLLDNLEQRLGIENPSAKLTQSFFNTQVELAEKIDVILFESCEGAIDEKLITLVYWMEFGVTVFGGAEKYLLNFVDRDSQTVLLVHKEEDLYRLNIVRKLDQDSEMVGLLTPNIDGVRVAISAYYAQEEKRSDPN